MQDAGRIPVVRSKVTKRYSTAQHGKTGDEVHHFAGSSTEHGHHHAGPKEESLGVGTPSEARETGLIIVRPNSTSSLQQSPSPSVSMPSLDPVQMESSLASRNSSIATRTTRRDGRRETHYIPLLSSKLLSTEICSRASREARMST